MDNLRHGMNGYTIPAYIEEILSHNYCPVFIRMSIVRDGQSYRFSYRPGILTRFRNEESDSYTRLVLLRSLITLNETAEEHLITADNYLIEPELIYTSGGSTEAGCVRLLYYPDARRIRFPGKLMMFTERIRDKSNREERELTDQFSEVLENGDLNRAKMFLDKNILRIENRVLNRAV